jgi:sugar lactone lactonase YvrE
MMLIQVGFCAEGEVPELRFEKNIGDMRGKGMENLSVAVSDDGTVYLLMVGGRVAVFDKDGKYQKSLKVDANWWPHTPYMQVLGNRVLVGKYQTDYSWVYAPQRKGGEEGKFQDPAMVATDEKGNIYVADTGNSRIQVFAADNTGAPEAVLDLPSKPTRIAVRGSLLAVALADRNLAVYERTGGQFVQKHLLKVDPGVSALALGQDTTVYAAFNAGPRYYMLKKYGIAEGKLQELAVVAPSYLEQWPNLFPTRVPMTQGPDGEIWFAADLHGKVLSLNPKDDQVRERLSGIHRPVSVGFGQGKTYVGGYPAPKQEGTEIVVVSESGDKETFAGGELDKNKGAPIWGLLPDEDGGVFVRIIEEGYMKGWPAFTIKKVSPDGSMKPLFDLGPIYAKRTKSHPSAYAYSLEFADDGNILLAVAPYSAVFKLGKDGKVIWEASVKPQGSADAVEFSNPWDLATDSKGNIWVCDSGTNKVYALSSEGKLLLEHGEYANVDEVEGKGFDGPSGIATATAGEQEYLYVGDAGNRRIVKFRIAWK